MNMIEEQVKIEEAINLLNKHYNDFHDLIDIARRTGHPVPMDTRGWSQIIVSVLTGLKGLDRKKGADLEDGSDVKGANTWEAIDTPRFNGVIKAGTKAASSDRLSYLDDVPYLFLVLWDHTDKEQARCRIWCVRSQKDPAFRDMCEAWYEARLSGKISSTNFQLHPPRGLDGNLIKNTYGHLKYPLLLCAVKGDNGYAIRTYDPEVLTSGECQIGDSEIDLGVLTESAVGELLANLDDEE
jgi:hypothetical protein